MEGLFGDSKSQADSACENEEPQSSTIDKSSSKHSIFHRKYAGEFYNCLYELRIILDDNMGDLESRREFRDRLVTVLDGQYRQHVWRLPDLEANLIEHLEARGQFVHAPKDKNVLKYSLLVSLILVLYAISFGVIYGHFMPHNAGGPFIQAWAEGCIAGLVWTALNFFTTYTKRRGWSDMTRWCCDDPEVMSKRCKQAFAALLEALFWALFWGYVGSWGTTAISWGVHRKYHNTRQQA